MFWHRPTAGYLFRLLTDSLTQYIVRNTYLLTYLPFVLGLIDSRQDRTNRLCAAGVAGSCQVLITASCRSFFIQMKTYRYNFFAPWLYYSPGSRDRPRAGDRFQSRVAPPPDHLSTRSQRILTPLDQSFKTIYYLTSYHKVGYSRRFIS